MIRLLVSACLLGERVRYDGGACPCEHPELLRWRAEGRVIALCPEVAAGLAVPRPPAEISGGRVVTRDGLDLTGPFRAGARFALASALANGARIAILKERSPSCGSSVVHDGTFGGALRPGEGIVTALLRAHGIEVFSEHQVRRAAARLAELEG